MQLSLTTVVATVLGAAGLAAADSMTIFHQNCHRINGCDKSVATFHTAYGSYSINGNPGCYYDQRVPGQTELCIDGAPNYRAHFYFSGQGRRCLVWDGNVVPGGDCGAQATGHCYYHNYVEVGCSW